MIKMNAPKLEVEKLREIHDFLISIAKKAGEMITSAKPSTGGAGTKKNSVDLVTETDQAVEKMISTTLQEKYPSFEFVGEETYKPGTRLTPAPTFIVDPIDGTTNFVHGYPYVSISLGLAVNLKPVVGVVYNPFTTQLFTAIEDQGSYLQIGQGPKQKLPLREPQAMESLGDLQICVEWGSDRSGNDFKVKSEVFKKLAGSKEEGGAMVHSLRSFGSAALNLSGVAAGYLDMYWEGGCWAWDVCAGWAILSEAGGRVVDGNPGNWTPILEERRYLAVRAGDGQDQMIDQFWKVVGSVGKLDVGV